ncbi:MAG: hypothetical protein WD315_02540 [Balneolaceae bacterium]
MTQAQLDHTPRLLRSILSRLLCPAIFFLAMASISQAQITNPEGGLNRPVEESIWAQTMRGNHYNEFWNYQFYFDNGIKMHVIFSAADFGGLKSAVSGIRISIFYPDGKTYQVAREYPIERLVQDRENHRFQLHPEREIYFTGKLPKKHLLVVNTSKGGVEYDFQLSFHNIESGLQWGNGQFSIKNEKIGIITHIPYADVTGYVRVNSNRQEVRGTAYMDHTFQNQTTTKLMHSGYRFVRHRNSQNWDLVYTLRPSDNREMRAIGYYLKTRDGKIHLYGAEQAILHDMERLRSTDIASRIQIRFDNGSELEITRVNNQESYPLLGELGWLARRAAKTFLGGEVIDFRGEGIIKKRGRAPLQGEYNFFVID